MNRLLAVIDRLFPSVPRGLRGYAEGGSIPGPGVRDHQHPGAGTTPARAWDLAVLHAWRKVTR